MSTGYNGWTRREVINGVDVLRLRHYVPKTPRSLPRLLMEVSFGIRLILAGWDRPDVILVVSPALISSGLAVLRASLTPRRPAIATWVQDIYSRGVIETSGGKTGFASFVNRIESWILRSSDGVVAIHDRFSQFLVTSLGVDPKQVVVIRNWTHLPPSPASGAKEMRKRLGWADSDLIVLHAGNMGKKQGLENVVQAARIAEERSSDVRFVLMGDGNQRRSLEALARGAKRLEFLSPLPAGDFQLALAAADFLLVNELPGVKDMAVPSKLTSYFNAGVPVIAATDEGSVTASEIEASGGGMRVNAADPAALVDLAEQLGKDTQTASKLGARGLQFRRDTLSEASALHHYDEFITSLGSSRGL